MRTFPVFVRKERSGVRKQQITMELQLCDERIVFPTETNQRNQNRLILFKELQFC